MGPSSGRCSTTWPRRSRPRKPCSNTSGPFETPPPSPSSTKTGRRWPESCWRAPASPPPTPSDPPCRTGWPGWASAPCSPPWGCSWRASTKNSCSARPSTPKPRPASSRSCSDDVPSITCTPCRASGWGPTPSATRRRWTSTGPTSPRGSWDATKKNSERRPTATASTRTSASSSAGTPRTSCAPSKGRYATSNSRSAPVTRGRPTSSSSRTPRIPTASRSTTGARRSSGGSRWRCWSAW
mmetsp:Transcript_452/g.1055  ORF Transcript_452/g.1055 Transcript_452/m.1055 type:complete len:240 (+) Transcript_452:1043-1762(+)